ncbi:MAG: lysophospholipid acyltransferase family protein [Desulfobacteraceae bacterium]|jgi:KDO2-lipid IV(A) lauroyltransferase|nr:lysophospholipid acyltransferase family protein [Desulfobacteraceae bacterium]
MKIIKKINNAVQYHVAYFFVRVFRIMPRRVGIRIAQGLALIFYFFARKHRRNTIQHLTMAFGNEKTEKEIRQIARRMVFHFAAAGVDAVRIPIFLKEGMDQYIRAENMHYLEDAYREGKGMILLTAHLGNWELMGAWLTWKKYPLRAVGKSLTNPRLNQLVLETRNQAGYINIARGKETREIIKALQQGYPLAMLMDQDTRVKGVWVDFFGRKANTPVGPVLLARKFNIPIIPAFAHLEPDLTYHVECFAPITVSDTGDPEKDLIADVQKCSDIYEKIIRKHLEQWVWMHRRWKRQPEEDAERHK